MSASEITPPTSVEQQDTAPVETAAEDNTFGDILSEFERGHAADGSAEPGFIEGTVIGIAPEAVLVDLGRKHEGLLPADSVRGPNGEITVKVGDTVRVNPGGRDETGYYLLSLFKVAVPQDWSGLQKAFDEKSVITGTVEELIKGGLRVDVGVRAFLPASRSGARDVPEMEKLVGEQIECRITKLDTEREDVVVDRRGVLEERAAEVRQKAFEAIEEDQVRTGTVRTVTDFGAFVDLGGVDGLLHISDMTWVRGARPSDIVKTDDTVEVKVLRVDRDKRKISLGMKQLTPDPWTVATASLVTDTRVRGKVVRVTDFGAFVELAPGVEGLVHVSEMSWSRKQKRAADIVQPGEIVEVVVLSIKHDDRRIALGLKQALGDPWEDAVQRFEVGAIVEGSVTNLAPFGAFIEMGDGVEGMIHIGDIVSGKRLDHPREALAAGQVVRAQVIEVDKGRRRFRLSMKSLEPTAADEYIAEHKAGDRVTGRVVEVSGKRMKIELADGVRAGCPVPVKEAAPDAPQSSADLGNSIAALAAKWKQGSVGKSGSDKGPKPGEIKEFRITSLDVEKKSIELEMLGE